MLMPSSFCLPLVECSRGTSPTHAANSLPLAKALPRGRWQSSGLLAVGGPMPRMASNDDGLRSAVRLWRISRSTSSGPPGQLLQFLPQLRKQQAAAPDEDGSGVFRNPRQRRVRQMTCRPVRTVMPRLQQQTADLVD